mgnify:CR=1 FL=1
MNSNTEYPDKDREVILCLVALMLFVVINKTKFNKKLRFNQND